jgi:hypothetical protein
MKKKFFEPGEPGWILISVIVLSLLTAFFIIFGPD